MESADDMHLEISHAPDAGDVARVRAGLMAYNESQVGPAQLDRIAIYLRGAENEIRGGLVGFIAFGWMTVDLLWVDEPLRGRGHGTVLLRQAEAIARDAGCVAVKLDTYEFQARPFYETLGYEVYGTLEGYPSDTRTYHLRKKL